LMADLRQAIASGSLLALAAEIARRDALAVPSAAPAADRPVATHPPSL
jgi:hypothetical protein